MFRDHSRFSFWWNNFFSSLLGVVLSFDFLAVVDCFSNLDISVIFQSFLPCHLQEFTVFLVKLLGSEFSCTSVFSLIARRLAVELTEIFLLLLSLFSFFTTFCLYFGLGVEDRLNLFLEILEKAPKTQQIKVLSIMILEYSLVCFSNVCEFGLGFRRSVVLWMVFDGQFSVCLLSLVDCGIFANFQNFVGIELLGGTLWEKLLKKFLLSLIFQLILFEKLFEGGMWINFFKHVIGFRDKIIFVALGLEGGPKYPPKREDGITEIMERSEQILPHIYRFLIILYLD